MRTRPTSFIGFMRAVQNCTAELSDGETLMLWSLAIEADYKTGKNSHPGNSRLMKVTHRKSPQGILFIIRGLIAKGLIEKTREGHPSFKGQSAEAAWYRICLENAAFPDASDHESEESETMKAQTFTVEPTMKVNGADHESKHPPTMKAEGADHESSELSLSPLPSQKSLPPSLPEIRKADGGLDSSKKPSAIPLSSKDLAAKERAFFAKHISEMGECSNRYRSELRRVAEEKGGELAWELMQSVFDDFIGVPGQIAGLDNKWGKFVKSVPERIAPKAEILKQHKSLLDDETYRARWEALPEDKRTAYQMERAFRDYDHEVQISNAKRKLLLSEPRFADFGTFTYIPILADARRAHSIVLDQVREADEIRQAEREAEPGPEALWDNTFTQSAVAA
jgi:hypothetical protein